MYKKRGIYIYMPLFELSIQQDDATPLLCYHLTPFAMGSFWLVQSFWRHLRWESATLHSFANETDPFA